MIPKAYRLKLESHNSFQGQKHPFPWGIIISASTEGPKWSVSVSKKSSPSAVVRNRLRRQIVQGLYQNRHLLNSQLSLNIIVTKSGFTGKQIVNQICSVFIAS